MLISNETESKLSILICLCACMYDNEAPTTQSLVRQWPKTHLIKAMLWSSLNPLPGCFCAKLLWGKDSTFLYSFVRAVIITDWVASTTEKSLSQFQRLQVQALCVGRSSFTFVGSQMVIFALYLHTAFALCVHPWCIFMCPNVLFF